MFTAACSRLPMNASNPQLTPAAHPTPNFCTPLITPPLFSLSNCEGRLLAMIGVTGACLGRLLAFGDDNAGSTYGSVHFQIYLPSSDLTRLYSALSFLFFCNYTSSSLMSLLLTCNLVYSLTKFRICASGDDINLLASDLTIFTKYSELSKQLTSVSYILYESSLYSF